MKENFSILTLLCNLPMVINKITEESEMELIKVKKLSRKERSKLGMPIFAPAMYNVILSGERYQFDNLIKKERFLTRIF